MTRKNTNKQYSLRKLKKGTASVAVALSVLGAGLASHHTVQASEDITKMMPILSGVGSAIDSDISADTLAKNMTKPEAIEKTIQVGREYKQGLYDQLVRNKKLEEDLRIKGLLADAASLRAKSAERELQELEVEYNQVEAEKTALESRKAELESALEGAMNFSAEDSARIKALEAEKTALESRKAELESALEGAMNFSAEDSARIKALEAELAETNAKVEKLEEEKQILEASRKRTNRDLETVRNAKKATEAELAETNAKVEKLEEEKQILEASRKRTNRDLEAARNAKKEVDAELAKLKAEAEALKEQLAKQAQEIEKLKDSKEASPKAPESPKTPEKPEVTPKDSGKSTMPWTALTPAKPIAKANMSSTDAKKDSHQLPSTGEAANPFFTAAAMSVMASAGVLALKRKEEN
uniref:M-like protein n=1 Tax=Streptococcus canis TaxID=1329 RepID=A0A4D6YRY0_STRCB|nr:M-like protein [Streptococcus canis]WLL73877.1 M protein [Streptococcus canis]WLL73902.1 M protein [Streptococcus canis]